MAGRRVAPDVVVSTYPLASQILGDLRGAGGCAVPVLTYLTDPAAHVSWVHPAVDAHLTVTAATAVQGPAAYGVRCTVAGPLVPARFAGRAGPAELAALRAELGLPAGRPVALLVGGLARPRATSLPRSTTSPPPAVTAVVLCGRNEALRRRAGRGPGWWRSAGATTCTG